MTADADTPSREGTAGSANSFRADQMLQRAEWAGSAFATFDRSSVLRIAEAAADAAAAKAQHYAEWAVRETGFGNAEHKVIKNRLCSRGIFDHYRDEDFTGFRVIEETKTVEVARPAGVVLALTPSTNPVSSVFYKVLLCLLTRNAIIVSPHPAAKECCADAARLMARAAEDAGAPSGLVQAIESPTLDLVRTLMESERTDVILATGGTAMVRAAYGSGNPALGVGPGNCPAYVHADADIREAAKNIADSKSFDNSVLCTNESAVVAHKDIAGTLREELKKQGCHLCTEKERGLVEGGLFPAGRFNVGMLGKPATWIAEQCGFRVPPKTRVLLVELERIGDDYPLSREKLCPVLGFYEVPNLDAGVRAAQAMVRHSGSGHSAAVHAQSPEAMLRFGTEMPVLRVVVNAPCSTGAAGFQTHLAPSMTVGTGYFGRSSVAENVKPHHLVQWVKVAVNKDHAMPAFEGLAIDRPPERRGHLDRGLPVSGRTAAGGGQGAGDVGRGGERDLREEIRRIVAEELRALATQGGR